MPISKHQRGRQIRQKLPDPPPTYDQTYIAQLADAVNDYMVQATAPAEVIAARFILVDQVIVDPSGKTPGALVDTSTLPTGMLYVLPVTPPKPGTPGNYIISIVRPEDPQS
jgi:hypothetical protein